MLLDAQTFSRETRLTPVHTMVQAEAGNGMWIPEFNPVDRPECCFIEALFWLFHCHGMCCAIIGDSAMYMAGKVATFSDVTMYVTCPVL